MRRQDTGILERPISFDPGVESIIVSLPAILPGLVDGRDRQPRLARRPVEETPSAPIKSLDLASVLLDDSLPDCTFILCPFHHIYLIAQGLCLASGLFKLGLRYLQNHTISLDVATLSRKTPYLDPEIFGYILPHMLPHKNITIDVIEDLIPAVFLRGCPDCEIRQARCVRIIVDGVPEVLISRECRWLVELPAYEHVDGDGQGL